jgi:methyl-accepting chemotaxis protein
VGNTRCYLGLILNAKQNKLIVIYVIMSKINNILSKIKTAKENQKTELASKEVSLSLTGVKSDYSAIGKKADKIDEDIKEISKRSLKLVSELKELANEMNNLKVDGLKVMQDLSRISNESEDKALDYEDIASRMQEADLDYKQPMALAEEAMEIMQEALQVRDYIGGKIDDIDKTLSNIKSI